MLVVICPPRRLSNPGMIEVKLWVRSMTPDRILNNEPPRHVPPPESPSMALLGNAILAVWNEVDADAEGDFNEWYLREHIPERTMVPGVNRGRRYRADEGSPRYMAFYEAAS